MKVKTEASVVYIIELTEEDKNRFFERMEEDDMRNHSYSILGEIFAALKRAKNPDAHPE